ncbi:MAG: hypothetical protein ACRDF5_07910 [bacterium]
MKVVAAMLIAAGLLAPAAWAAGAIPGNARLIVPGQRIGMARLGMTEDELNQMNDLQLCQVSAGYDASGRAVRLETNWGGRAV